MLSGVDPRTKPSPIWQDDCVFKVRKKKCSVLQKNKKKQFAKKWWDICWSQTGQAISFRGWKKLAQKPAENNSAHGSHQSYQKNECEWGMARAAPWRAGPWRFSAGVGANCPGWGHTFQGGQQLSAGLTCFSMPTASSGTRRPLANLTSKFRSSLHPLGL